MRTRGKEGEPARLVYVWAVAPELEEGRRRGEVEEGKRQYAEKGKTSDCRRWDDAAFAN